jgi:hypothetical protein
LLRLDSPESPTPTALAGTIRTATAVSGLSRSAIYREAARGNIVLLKLGRTTLVDMESVRAFLAGLPRAAIHRAGALPRGGK